MALEKQCSRYLMKGLGITAYDSESDVGVVYEDIITSEYYRDTENNTRAFGKLGTVFSIRAYGYRAYVESTAADPIAEAHAIKFEGASRICIYPKDTHYPLQIVAYLGRSSSGSAIKPNFFPGYYLTEDSVSPNVSGMTSTAPTLPDRWYITATYENLYAEDQLTFWASTTPDFSDVTGNYWPIAITSVTRKQYLDGSNPDADWVLQYIEPKEYGGTDIKPSAILSGFQTGTAARLMRKKREPVAYLYGPNKVKIPEIPKEIMVYPHVILHYLAGDGSTILAYGYETAPYTELKEPFIGDPYDVLRIDSGARRSGSLNPDGWYLNEPDDATDTSLGYSSCNLKQIIWTNFDIYTSDGTLYMSKTDPVPVYD